MRVSSFSSNVLSDQHLNDQTKLFNNIILLEISEENIAFIYDIWNKKNAIT